MSKIAIVIKPNNSKSNARLLLELKTVINTSIDSLNSKIADNEPIYTALLFFNDHKVVTDRLLSIISILEKDKVDFDIYELEEYEVYNSVDFLNQKISMDTLQNILFNHNS